MRILRLAFALGATLLCATTASGQVIMSTPIYPFYSWRARTLKDGDLTTSQKQQVDSVAKAYWEMLHRIDGQLRVVSRDSLDRWLTSIRDDQLDDIRTLLTPKQRQLFDRNRRALTRP